jgi:tetratricopeptide (TPR) repeat protein
MLLLELRRGPLSDAETGTAFATERHGTIAGKLIDVEVRSRPNCPYTCPMQHPHYPSGTPQKGTARQAPISILDGMLATAIKHHRQGQLPEAERIYRRILSIDPRHADGLHMLGTLAHQVGRQDIAVQLIRAAIGIQPGQAAYYSNLGTILQAQGLLAEATVAYQDALDRNPSLAEAQMNLGTVLEAQGRPGLAASRFRAALALRPDLAEAHMNLGNILQAQGKLAEAVASHERALALKPDFAEACFNRANALQAQGKLDDAVAGYQRALALKPAMPEAHANLGNALQAQQRIDDAVACYERALALKPDYAEAHYNLGNARQAQDLLAEATSCYERALALKPQLAEAHYNMGNTLQAQDKLEAAADCFERAIAIKPAYAEAQYNLACVLQQQGRLDQALPRFQTALDVKPDYAQARFGQALAQIQSGDFARGWRTYESRWQSIDHDTPMRPYPLPLWTGEHLSAGRLLLWGEQGIGDEIMFAGLVPDALRTGSAITLDCDPRLQPLFARSFPEIEAVSSPNPDARFAAHLPTGSLPALFRASESAFAAPSSPYLVPDRKVRDRFRSRYSGRGRLIGLAWQTRNPKTGRKRSIDLAALAPLFTLPDIRWISLQYGDLGALEQQAAAASGPILPAPGAPIFFDRAVDQFADTDRFAAQVAAMDHVLTIDNSTAHLAGALGVPVWLMLPYAADWRWLKDREDSPWYPTMRLFRQPAPGDWESVLHSVHSALKDCFNEQS